MSRKNISHKARTEGPKPGKRKWEYTGQNPPAWAKRLWAKSERRDAKINLTEYR
jgi:hypothetical protein